LYWLPNSIRCWLGSLMMARKWSKDHATYRAVLKACISSAARFGGIVSYEDFEKGLARRKTGLVCREAALRASLLGEPPP